MQHASAQEPPERFEMNLREHLSAASGAPSSYPPPPSNTAQGADAPYQSSESTSPHEHLDPSVARSQHLPYSLSGDSGADDGMSADARKGKRELSTSKRAAQNRAAQRAFRQRKEGYIKKLEEQVKEFQTMEQGFRSLQNENYQLREYILNLQSRLLENQSDIPPPPLHVNLQGSSAPAATSGSATAGRHHDAEHQLRRELQRQASPGPAPIRPSAAHTDDRPSHSTYGLGEEYADKRTRTGDARPDS